MDASTFSRYTNDRDYCAVVQLLFALLYSPQLYHQRGVQRKQLEWLQRSVVAVDATNFDPTRTVLVPQELRDLDEPHEIEPDEGGLKLHLAARVDGDHKHPLGATVTAGETHETTQFDYLHDDVEAFADLDSPIWVYDVATPTMNGSVG